MRVAFGNVVVVPQNKPENLVAGLKDLGKRTYTPDGEQPAPAAFEYERPLTAQVLLGDDLVGQGTPFAYLGRPQATQWPYLKTVSEKLAQVFDLIQGKTLVIPRPQTQRGRNFFAQAEAVGREMFREEAAADNLPAIFALRSDQAQLRSVVNEGIRMGTPFIYGGGGERTLSDKAPMMNYLRAVKDSGVDFKA